MLGTVQQSSSPVIGFVVRLINQESKGEFPMKRIPAQNIIDLPYGTTIIIDGEPYITVMDMGNHTDLIVNIKTGWIGSWCKLVLWSETVEVIFSE